MTDIFASLDYYCVIQGSQTRGPQAACGPWRCYLQPATHYLKF